MHVHTYHDVNINGIYSVQYIKCLVEWKILYSAVMRVCMFTLRELVVTHVK